MVTVGRIVHYVSAGSKDGRFPVTCRAAIVVETPVSRPDAETVTLAVLNPTGIHFAPDVPHSEEPESYTWHWPERVE